MTPRSFTQDVKEFHNTIIEIIKKYQFRDRNEITCYGISVSQCYILETLYSHGSMTMKDLSCKMHLAISTITRVVDQLEKNKYVIRAQDKIDTRKRNIKLTKKGENIFLKSWESVFESEKEIFERIKPEHRKLLINLLKDLNKSVELWQNSCKVK